MLSNPRKFALILAGLAALAVAGLVMFGGAEQTWVARMTTNVNALSPVLPDNVELVKVDGQLVEEGAISGVDREKVAEEVRALITNTTTQYPLFRGQQIRPDQFSSTGATLSRPLGPDERLISLRATVSSSVAGAIRAGDRVDIVATDNASGGLAGVVAENIEIVKVTSNESALDNAGNGGSGAAAEGSSEGQSADAAQQNNTPRPVGGTFIIRIPASLAPTISAVDSSASRVYLVYRSPDAVDAKALATDLRTALCANGGC